MALFRLALRGSYVLSVLLLLCACTWEEPATIHRTTTNVDGFDLEHAVFDGAPEKAYGAGQFGAGYATKANYDYFTYRGELYRSVGGGSILVRPFKQSPARFTVRETVLAIDELGGATSSRLQIFDKATGEEVARRGLVDGVLENGTGWKGDHAMHFVRKVLVPGPGRNKNWFMPYRPVEAQIGIERAAAAVPPYPHPRRPHHCPDAIRIGTRSVSLVVEGRGFWFKPAEPMLFVACDSKRVLVASGIWGYELYLDLLTLDGEHLSQGQLRMPLPSGINYVTVADLDLSTDTLRMVLLTNAYAEGTLQDVSAYARVRVTVRMDGSASAKPSAGRQGP